MLSLNNLYSPIGRYFLTGIFLTLISCGDNLTEQQNLEIAKSYLEEGRLRAATIELRNTLQKNSHHAEARFLLGSIELETDYLASAEKEFRRAAQAGWDEEPTQLNLARVLAARNKYQVLLDDIKIIKTWSATTRANISALRAIAEANLNKISQARITLGEGEAYNPEAFQVFTTKIEFQISGILDGDASDTLKKALSLYPDNTELLLLYGTNDLQNKNIERAIDTFKRIIDRDPANLLTRNGRKARIDLAGILITENHYQQAKTTLAPLLEKNHRDPVANFLMSLLAFNHGHYGEAEMHMRKLLKIVPDHIYSQQLMGKIKFELHDYDQATHHLTSSLKETPDILLIYKLLARTYIAQNKSSEAVSTINKALSISPNDPETLTLLSLLKFNQGNNAAGIDALTQAIELNPKNSALVKQLVIAHIKMRDPDKALKEINNFRRLSKNEEEAQKLSIRAYLLAGDIDAAIKITNELLAGNPQDPEILSLIGNLHAANNKHLQARKYFNQSLQLKENFTPAIIGLAHLESVSGNFDDASKLYRSLVEADNGGITPMLALADLAVQQDHTGDMLYWLERARDTSPTDTKSRAMLANYYLQASQTESAKKYIQEAIRIAPEQTELLSLYGKILLAQKNYREALSVLQGLVKKSSDATDARILLAQAYLHLQMTDAARKHLLIALMEQESNISALSLLAETELRDNNYDKSIEYSLKLRKLQPDHYISYLQEGEAWLAKQDYNNAILSFNKAWQRQKKAEIAQMLFSASKHVKDFENAIKPLLSWLQDNPDDDAMRLFLAFTYLEAERNDMAIQEYEKVLEKTPDDAALLNNLAWLYSLEGNPNALDFADRAYRLSPEDPGVLDTYGWILVQHKQTDKGLRLLKLAMNKRPDNLEIQYHYAMALTQSGYRNKGRKILEKLLDDGRDFADKHEAEVLLKTMTLSK